uniref:ATP synthase complex subunit 8 n=1 Tax=Anopheles homunculus TaxID=369908 RepID=A0A172N3C0_9DIPT|nr:ATP synthase F0 subunit 8 [Anopheles homunculus]AND46640.1 ATP synthase F0 subunit 8 [Anopheles homunculus]AWB98228.1 ATP synthase F0 subunit 8 [Anopheles homunculus]AWB99424.1 ATP synthase F0 subunit 8 [Anopheles homunculus]AWB99840.1 ATP synthase F0 subunit 8 [Anopheles homunculus]
MPQMAPINWLILFLIFSFTLVIFNMLNYYCIMHTPMKSSQSLTTQLTSLNWKW